MFGEPRWVVLFVMALPVLGFVLGALWMKGRIATRRIATPPMLAEPHLGLETRMLDALDRVESQLSELAERQDFAERILAQRRDAESVKSRSTEWMHTPV